MPIGIAATAASASCLPVILAIFPPCIKYSNQEQSYQRRYNRNNGYPPPRNHGVFSFSSSTSSVYSFIRQLNHKTASISAMTCSGSVSAGSGGGLSCRPSLCAVMDAQINIRVRITLALDEPLALICPEDGDALCVFFLHSCYRPPPYVVINASGSSARTTPGLLSTITQDHGWCGCIVRALGADAASKAVGDGGGGGGEGKGRNHFRGAAMVQAHSTLVTGIYKPLAFPN